MKEIAKPTLAPIDLVDEIGQRERAQYYGDGFPERAQHTFAAKPGAYVGLEISRVTVGAHKVGEGLQRHERLSRGTQNTEVQVKPVKGRGPTPAHRLQIMHCDDRIPADQRPV